MRVRIPLESMFFIRTVKASVLELFTASKPGAT